MNKKIIANTEPRHIGYRDKRCVFFDPNKSQEQNTPPLPDIEAICSRPDEMDAVCERADKMNLPGVCLAASILFCISPGFNLLANKEEALSLQEKINRYDPGTQIPRHCIIAPEILIELGLKEEFVSRVYFTQVKQSEKLVEKARMVSQGFWQLNRPQTGKFLVQIRTSENAHVMAIDPDSTQFYDPYFGETKCFSSDDELNTHLFYSFLIFILKSQASIFDLTIYQLALI